MLKKIKNYINNIEEESRRKKEEQERLEKERIIKIKENLSKLDKKSLLVEILFELKEIRRNQDILLREYQELNNHASSLDNDIMCVHQEIDQLKSNQ